MYGLAVVYFKYLPTYFFAPYHYTPITYASCLQYILMKSTVHEISNNKKGNAVSMFLSPSSFSCLFSILVPLPPRAFMSFSLLVCSFLSFGSNLKFIFVLHFVSLKNEFTACEQQQRHWQRQQQERRWRQQQKKNQQ